MDDDNQFIMASTFISCEKWKLKTTFTALRASQSGSFFLLLSHRSGVSVRLTRIAFVSDTCNVSLKAAHHIGDAQMMVDV